jgi:hypothetical protein
VLELWTGKIINQRTEKGGQALLPHLKPEVETLKNIENMQDMLTV